MTDLTPNDLSHLSDEEFTALAPQGYHATGPAETLSPAPPPELVQQWDDEGTEMFRCRFRPEYQMHIATRAAQWGAARRSKPPSLKEQALQVLEDLNLDSAHYNILLSALEGLDTLTYACDRIRRMAGPVGPEGVVLSRSDASRIRTCIASALGMNDHELACKLADAQLASEEDPEVAKQ